MASNPMVLSVLPGMLNAVVVMVCGLRSVMVIVSGIRSVVAAWEDLLVSTALSDITEDSGTTPLVTVMETSDSLVITTEE